MSTQAPVDVELPAVVDAAQAVLFVAAEEHRGAAVRAGVADQADASRCVAERDEVLAQQSHLIGGQSGEGSSNEGMAGNQYWRSRLPMACRGRRDRGFRCLLWAAFVLTPELFAGWNLVLPHRPVNALSAPQRFAWTKLLNRSTFCSRSLSASRITSLPRQSIRGGARKWRTTGRASRVNALAAAAALVAAGATLARRRVSGRLRWRQQREWCQEGRPEQQADHPGRRYLQAVEEGRHPQAQPLPGRRKAWTRASPTCRTRR